MLGQTFVDALIVFGMFLLRIGLPVAILFGIAAWLERRLTPSGRQDTGQTTSRARIIPFNRTRQTKDIPPPASTPADGTVRRTAPK